MLPTGNSDLLLAAEGTVTAVRAVGIYCADLDDDAGQLLGALGGSERFAAGRVAWRAAWNREVRRGLLKMGFTLAGPKSP